MSKQKVWVLLILCNLFWAGNYVFGKYVTVVMTPLWITFSRWLIATPLLLIIAFYVEKPQWEKIKEEWIRLSIMGILGIIIYNLSLYSALKYTSPTNAALVTALNPVIMVWFSFVLLKERISKIQSLGLVISLLGVFIVLTEGKLMRIIEANFNIGDLLILLAIVSWAMYSIIGKGIKNFKPITITAVSALFATIMLAPFAIHQGIELKSFSPLALTGIAYMVLFPSIGSFIFWNISIKEIGASRAGVSINLIPVFTALISWFLGDKITLAQVAGGICVFGGVYLTTGMFELFLSEKQNKKDKMKSLSEK